MSCTKNHCHRNLLRVDLHTLTFDERKHIDVYHEEDSCDIIVNGVVFKFTRQDDLDRMYQCLCDRTILGIEFLTEHVLGHRGKLGGCADIRKAADAIPPKEKKTSIINIPFRPETTQRNHTPPPPNEYQESMRQYKTTHDTIAKSRMENKTAKSRRAHSHNRNRYGLYENNTLATLETAKKSVDILKDCQSMIDSYLEELELVMQKSSQ